MGSLLFIVGPEKANLSLSCSANGVVKKQSWRSKTIRSQYRGTAEGEGIPGCKDPIGELLYLFLLNL